jgi:hypothetical protein
MRVMSNTKRVSDDGRGGGGGGGGSNGGGAAALSPSSSNIAETLQNLLNTNKFVDEAKRKKRTRNRFEGEPTEDEAQRALQSLTLTEYHRLCQIYTGQRFNLDEVSAVDISDDANPINPYRVFSLANSMRLAKLAGAVEEYCIETNYFDPTRGPIDETGVSYTYVFPNPENVWRMKSSYMQPGNALRLYWPCIKAINIDENDPHRIAYINSMSATTGMDRAQAAFVYDNSIAHSSHVDDVPNTFKALREKNERAMIKARTQHSALGTSEALLRDALLRIRMEGLTEFMRLFSTEGEPPEAVRSIAMHLNAHLHSHNHNFCLPIPKVTKNLTRFGDEMVMLLICIETLFNVNTQHKEVLALFFKQLHVYTCSPFNPHTLYGGPKAAGKSFSFLLVMQWLIQGTYTNVAYSSPKAYFVPGHRLQFMLRFYEDVMPGFLGVSGNSKGSDTCNSDWEAVVKAWLTSGALECSVLDQTQGSRLLATTAEIKADVHSVVNVATNTSEANIPDAMASRYDRNTCQTKDRVDGGGLLNKSNKKTNDEQKSAKELFITRFRRNQSFCAIIFQLIYTHILNDIDMTVADQIFTQTLATAKATGLTEVDNIRNLQRVQMVCKVLVVWDAISIVWDSVDSPLLGVPHNETHFMLVSRYLRALPEHACFALGLLSNQYEDRIVYSIVEDLKSTYFKAQTKKAKSKKATAAPPLPTGPYRLTGDADVGNGSSSSSSSSSSSAQQQQQQQQQQQGQQYRQTTIDQVNQSRIDSDDANYYIASMEILNNGRGGHDTDNSSELIKFLAKKQLSTMQEKPLRDDLVAGYEKLTNTAMPDVTFKPKNDYDPVRHVPALAFRNGNIMLHRDLVKRNVPNSLMQCMAKVLNHKYAKDADYVYGSTDTRFPFLFNVIKVNKDDTPLGGRKVLEVVDPNYFDPELIAITENYLQGMNAIEVEASRSKSTNRRRENGLEAVSRIALRNAFASLPKLTVNVDLNDYAEELFKLYSGLPLHDFVHLPEGHPLVQKHKLVLHAHQHGLPLIDYPKDLPHSKPNSYHNNQKRDQQANPDKYTLSRSLDLAREQQQARLHADEAAAAAASSSSSSSSSSQPPPHEGEVDNTEGGATDNNNNNNNNKNERVKSDDMDEEEEYEEQEAQQPEGRDENETNEPQQQPSGDDDDDNDKDDDEDEDEDEELLDEASQQQQRQEKQLQLLEQQLQDDDDTTFDSFDTAAQAQFEQQPADKQQQQDATAYDPVSDALPTS